MLGLSGLSRVSCFEGDGDRIERDQRSPMNQTDQTNQKTVLVAVNDLFFYTKIRDALLPRGYRLERIRASEDLQTRTTPKPCAVILNMNDEKLDAFDLLSQLRADGLSSPPVLAFANHEETETWRRAKELGVSKIVSRNEFSARTHALVEEVIGCQPTARL